MINQIGETSVALHQGNASEALMAEQAAATFKSAMRRFAASLTIVTAANGSDRFGMTATSVTSVTASPPALLVCINRSAGIHRALHVGSAFCVNVLSGHHAELSRVFGGAVVPAERFHHGDWRTSEGGVPFLHDAQCNLFCEVDVLLGYGSHTIFVGRVQEISLQGEYGPLIYGDGRLLGV